MSNGKTILEQTIAYSLKKFSPNNTFEENMETLREIFGDSWTEEEIKAILEDS